MPTYVCPTCSKTLLVGSRGDAPFRPFCCERCKMVDLARWFDEEYRIELPFPPPPGVIIDRDREESDG